MLVRIIAKDYYICMRDRKINTLCEKSFGHIGVAPLYDYERSFNLDYFCDVYYNPLFSKYKGGLFMMQEINLDLIKTLWEYDTYFYEQMNKMIAFDMARALDNIRERYKINIPNETKEYYLEFNNIRKEELSKALKKVG